jgi:hypothetical protein
MSSPVTRVLSLVFLVGFFVLAILFNAHKPRVLILHSYNPDYAWSRDEDAGIQTLAKKTGTTTRSRVISWTQTVTRTRTG